MKKIAAFLFLTAFSAAASAQLPAFTIGPKIGYNSNSLSFKSDSISAGLQEAFQFGLFARIGSKIYLQPEINYQVKGGIFQGDAGSAFSSQEMVLKTVNIPVLMGVRFIHAGPMNLRVMGGPTLSFVVDKYLEAPYRDKIWPVQSADDIKKALWSVQVGGGMDIFFLTLDVRYEMGWNNMYAGTDNFKLRDNIFNVSLGLKLF